MVENKYEVKAKKIESIRPRRNGEVKELDVFDQIKKVIPLIKKVAVILFALMALFFAFMVISIGIELAIIGELILAVIIIILISPFATLKKIPNMHIGVPLIFGERKGEYILKEGWAIVIKGIFEHLVVYAAKVNLDFKLTVHAKNNAQAELEVSLLLGIDKSRVLEYLDAGGVFGEDVVEVEHNAGEEKGIADSIIDIAKSTITTTARTKSLDDILAIDPEITSNAIKSITKTYEGEEVNALRTNVDRKIAGLGMLLRNFVIKSVKAVGKIADVYERQAVEMLEREFKETNIGTKIRQIKMMSEGHEGGIDPETMFLILTEQELIEKGHKITPGLNRLLNSLAGLIEEGAGIGEMIELLKSFKGSGK
jgi:hypothetical protein